MATARDVTEAKRMQAALRESEQRFRAVFDNTPVGIGEVALSGDLVRVNRSFSQILGYTSDEMLTMRRLKDLLVSDNIAADLAAKQRLLSGEIDTYTAERCFRRKGGGVGAHRGLGAGEQGPGGVHLFGLS
jgi:PAS domain S-box-containing protein